MDRERDTTVHTLEVKPETSLLILSALRSFWALALGGIAGASVALGLAVLGASEVLAIAAAIVGGILLVGVLLARTGLQISQDEILIRNPLNTYKFEAGQLLQIVVQPISYRTNFVETDRCYRVVFVFAPSDGGKPVKAESLATDRRAVEKMEDVMGKISVALHKEGF